MNSNRSSPADEHKRYKVQAEWTAGLRARILKQLRLQDEQFLLEVGSGTGAITESILKHVSGRVIGVDIDQSATSFAKNHCEQIDFAVADGMALPFGTNAIDVAFCHFLLLWVNDPLVVLRDMCRVVRPGGWLIAFAEPDYGGRIDYPDEFEELGALQLRSLAEAGAQPAIGRKLRALFNQVGLKSVTSGVLGGEWHAQLDEQLAASEWETLRRDLEGWLDPVELERMKLADQDAWENGSRILFVPTFYAYGQVP
jgi:ubiquinone/menaquinone biosynthesis C-methylase UbiE